jgi:hypothetical protein
MLKALVSCTVVMVMGIGAGLAGEREAEPRITHVIVPGTAFEVVIGATKIDQGSIAPPPALINAIATWLSSDFALPKISELPSIAFVPPAAMIAIRYRALVPDRSAGKLGRGSMSRSLDQPDVVAVYDDEAKTIYLPEGWSAHTAAGLSVLVHEMVHHIQNMGGLKYECPEAREKPAFAAQQAWLAISGSNLEAEFRIDPLTVLVRTNCLN